MDATTTGVDVYSFLTTTNNADINGTLTCTALIETSDFKLKENVKEVNAKDCYSVVKYIKPKTFTFVTDEDKKSNLGFIADDVKNAKLPPEWDNIIFYNDDGMKLLAYNKMTVILRGAVQEMQKEITSVKGETTKLKKKMKNDSDFKKHLSKFHYIGSTSSKSSATENMKQIKELDIHEKSRTDMLLFNTLKDVIERVEKLEENKKR